MEKRGIPYYINWAITGKCNLNCIHCRGMESKDLTTKEAKKLIDEIKGLNPQFLTIDGGEPLMREDLFSLLKYATEKEIKTYVITNGMFLTEEVVKRLKKMEIKVMVSLDSVVATKYNRIRRGGDFERVVKGIKTCSEHNILDAVNMVLMKINYSEIPAMIEFAEQVKAKQVVFIGLKQTENHLYQKLVLNSSEWKEAISLIAKTPSKIDIFVDEPFFWPAVKEFKLSPVMKRDRGESGIRIQEDNSCIFGKYLFIQPNGDVQPCTFAPIVFGNIKRISLSKIWDDMQDSELLQKINEPSVRRGHCKNCKYFAECKGCRSRIYALTNDWFQSDPICPLREKKKSET